jgi:hypothetical protein
MEDSVAWGRGTTRMSISKIEFYEGAAIHRLIRSLGDVRVRIDGDTLVVNEGCRVYTKYCTRTRGPWTFTFAPTERRVLVEHSSTIPLVIGLVCGADGIAALRFEEFALVTGSRDGQVAVACARRYNEHFAVSGPACELGYKIAPSEWSRIFHAYA